MKNIKAFELFETDKEKTLFKKTFEQGIDITMEVSGHFIYFQQKNIGDKDAQIMIDKGQMQEIINAFGGL